MKNAVFTILFLFTLSFTSFATEDVKKVITGKVVDQSNHESLAGVKVSVEGTSITTYTDMNGNYTLFIPQNSDIKISFSMVSYENSILSTTTAQTAKEINLSPVE